MGSVGCYSVGRSSFARAESGTGAAWLAVGRADCRFDDCCRSRLRCLALRHGRGFRRGDCFDSHRLGDADGTGPGRIVREKVMQYVPSGNTLKEIPGRVGTTFSDLYTKIIPSKTEGTQNIVLQKQTRTQKGDKNSGEIGSQDLNKLVSGQGPQRIGNPIITDPSSSTL